MRASQHREILQTSGYDPKVDFLHATAPTTPWDDNIITFATHPSFCGERLYPRQLTLLKLIYLQTELMTAYDIDVIEEWRRGFFNPADAKGVQPDIWDRVDYLKQRGYRRFPHIEAVIGRRGSKGKIGGILGAETMAYLYSLDDWQAHYGISPGKDGYLSVVATGKTQATKFQFSDIRDVVTNCEYLQRAISKNQSQALHLRTPSDLRRIAYMKANKIPIEYEIATIRAVPMSSQSSTGRGATGFANFFDEFAHMLSGSSSRSGEEVYEAYQPSLDQFGKDSLTYIPSSPFCLAPETPVLTEDLRWVPVDSLKLGDKLIGFDEYAPEKAGVGRRWRQAEVTETSIIQAPRYKLTMESGKEIVGTGEHLWLTKRVGGMGKGKGRGDRSQSYPQNWCWIKISDLRPGDQIKSLGADPWRQDDSRSAGYLAGFFDGEGYLSGPAGGGSGLNLGYTQNYGITQEYVEGLLKDRDFNSVTWDDRDGKCARARIGGGVAEVMRFLGTVRPERLLPKFAEKLYGSRIYGPANPAVDTVVSVEYLDEGPVVALGTSTHTLVADGLLSHNTKVGRFYSLYKEGSVLMSTYDDDTGRVGYERKTMAQLGMSDGDAEEAISELTANPEMLIIQLPSWGLYEDWQKSKQLVGHKIASPIQAYDDRMKRLERSNPEKFKVERRSQFASVMDAWLDPQKVDEMFEPWLNKELEAKERGILRHRYYMHCDPALNNDNFALAIGHSESAPPDEYGDVWPHVVIDFMKVWKPSDYEDNKIDYIQVLREISDILERFPSTVRASFDQWQNQAFIPILKRDFPGVQVAVENFTQKANADRMERFKTALNLGWVHAYRDDFYGDTGDSLLELECKFLQKEKNKVDHPGFGPVTTKDLFDCVNVVTDQLLKDALDLYNRRLLGEAPAVGSTNVNEIRSGRAELGMEQFSRHAPGKSGNARDNLSTFHDAAINKRRGRGMPSVSPARRRGR